MAAPVWRPLYGGPFMAAPVWRPLYGGLFMAAPVWRPLYDGPCMAAPLWRPLYGGPCMVHCCQIPLIFNFGAPFSWHRDYVYLRYVLFLRPRRMNCYNVFNDRFSILFKINRILLCIRTTQTLLINIAKIVVFN